MHDTRTDGPTPCIEVGDLIQLHSWFGDAWAEVTWASGPHHDEGREPGQMFKYVRRDKYGTRSRDELHLGYAGGYAGLLRLAKPAEVNPFHNNINLQAHRVRYGALWDAGECVGQLERPA